MIVVKVGGSLLSRPNLGQRLCDWLEALSSENVLLIAGGGEAADWVRRLDRLHELGEERAHWLAVQAMALNARLLAYVLPGAVLVTRISDPASSKLCVLDVLPWLQEDDRRPDHLPHSWAVTSDSIAARVAYLAGAKELILLKSCPVPDASVEELAGKGIVDEWFPRVAAKLANVRVVCFSEELWTNAARR